MIFGSHRRSRCLCGAVFLTCLAAGLATDVMGAERKTGKRQHSQSDYESYLRKPMIARPSRVGEEERWQEILAARRPSSIVALCDSFRFDFPNSPRSEDAWKMSFNAFRAMRVKSEVGLSEEFFDSTHGDPAFNASLLGAARGDPESAFNVAWAFATGKSGIAANAYRHEQWLRFAADLGHGRAAWDLAQRFNHQGLVAEAAHYEARSRENGYKPPPRLSNRDY